MPFLWAFRNRSLDHVFISVRAVIQFQTDPASCGPRKALVQNSYSSRASWALKPKSFSALASLALQKENRITVYFNSVSSKLGLQELCVFFEHVCYLNFLTVFSQHISVIIDRH